MDVFISIHSIHLKAFKTKYFLIKVFSEGFALFVVQILFKLLPVKEPENLLEVSFSKIYMSYYNFS